MRVRALHAVTIILPAGFLFAALFPWATRDRDDTQPTARLPLAERPDKDLRPSSVSTSTIVRESKRPGPGEPFQRGWRMIVEDDQEGLRRELARLREAMLDEEGSPFRELAGEPGPLMMRFLNAQTHADPDVRWLACEVFRYLPCSETRRFFENLLMDQDERVRELAIEEVFLDPKFLDPHCVPLLTAHFRKFGTSMEPHTLDLLLGMGEQVRELAPELERTLPRFEPGEALAVAQFLFELTPRSPALRRHVLANLTLPDHALRGATWRLAWKLAAGDMLEIPEEAWQREMLTLRDKEVRDRWFQREDERGPWLTGPYLELARSQWPQSAAFVPGPEFRAAGIRSPEACEVLGRAFKMALLGYRAGLVDKYRFTETSRSLIDQGTGALVVCDQWLREPTPDLRIQALAVSAGIRPRSFEAGGLIARGLVDESADVRDSATVAVRDYGPKAAACFPVLCERFEPLLRSRDIYAHDFSDLSEALFSLGKASAPLAPRIGEFLRETREWDRASERFVDLATRWLGSLGTPEAVQLLEQRARNPAVAVEFRVHALKTLQRTDEDTAWPIVREFLEERTGHCDLATGALEVLAMIAGRSGDVLQLVAQLREKGHPDLEDKDFEVLLGLRPKLDTLLGRHGVTRLVVQSMSLGELHAALLVPGEDVFDEVARRADERSLEFLLEALRRHPDQERFDAFVAYACALGTPGERALELVSRWVPSNASRPRFPIPSPTLWRNLGPVGMSWLRDLHWVAGHELRNQLGSALRGDLPMEAQLLKVWESDAGPEHARDIRDILSHFTFDPEPLLQRLYKELGHTVTSDTALLECIERLERARVRNTK